MRSRKIAVVLNDNRCVFETFRFNTYFKWESVRDPFQSKHEVRALALRIEFFSRERKGRVPWNFAACHANFCSGRK